MTDKEREHFRWQFAGQAISALATNGFIPDEVSSKKITEFAVAYAAALIAELDRTAVKGCEHDWDRSVVLTSMPPQYRCKKCGEAVACSEDR